MPRIGGRDRPPQAHPAAAAQAAKNQAAAPQIDNRPKIKTESSPTTNRGTRMTPFKPGFERETEDQLADAFKRPPRYFKEDTPFYPWLPCVPKVQFKLNFKG